MNTEIPNSMLKKIEEEIRFDPISLNVRSHDCDLQNHLDEYRKLQDYSNKELWLSTDSKPTL